MATDRLHLRDSFLLDFTAHVIRTDQFQDKPSLVLDRTAFYAEAGGQQADRGVLRVGASELRVLDVQVTDDGVVHHVLASPASLDEGAEVRGVVDARHRRDQMSQHTAQHMLSRAFHDLAGLETASARMGSEVSTIDLSAPAVSQEALAAAENAVNRTVLEDREIRILFPSSDELKSLRLLTAPKVEKDIRVIEVDGFDAMPCGGTHCSRTGQVGPVAILGTEKYKGMTRVTFIAGQRAIDRARADDAMLRELSATLTCARGELPMIAERVKNDVRSLSQQLGQVRAELMRFVAAELLAQNPPDVSGTTFIATTREGADIESLRALASTLTKRADVVALIGSKDASGDWIVVVDRGASAPFEAGRWFKSMTQTHGGRGGGRPEHAEGRFPGTVDWNALVDAARQR